MNSRFLLRTSNSVAILLRFCLTTPIEMHKVTNNSVWIGMALKRFSWGIAALAALAMAGCATTGPTSARSDKELVAERAQKRWDALVKNDFGEAYRYISPAGRAIVTEQAYAAQFKRDFWSGAKVEKVECGAPDVCEVDVMISYEFGGLNMKTGVREKWNKQNSIWWFVLER